MAKPDLEKVKDQSVQARARGEGATLSLLLWAVRGAELISPWWSKQRDADLRRFWKSVDHLAGAVYTIQSRLITIPFQVLPRDKTVKAHVRQAEEFTDMLVNQSEFGEGWGTFYSKFVEDIVTQDNGSMGEIIGEGRPDGPIIGMPNGIAHLDSWRCTRSGDPEFPIIYQDTDGKHYKMHYTRVVFSSQMPSPSVTMKGVGFCAVSRCINIAQNLLDILVYKQEKLGSRPHRNILVTKGGLDPEVVRSAFIRAESMMNAQQNKRYSKTVVIGHEDMPDAEIQQIDLASLPDGFDERESITLGMAAIALAFGMDARELFPAMSVGATRAEAMIQHMKQRGKGPGQILEMTERLFEYKVLPAHLKMVFDYQDDAQDKQVAEIRSKRSERHEKDLLSGSVDVRTVREQMTEDGDLTHDQFMAMELEDGRLEDGTDVLTLFVNDDYIDLLDIGIDDPLNVQENDREEVIKAIEVKRRELWVELNTATPRHRRPVREALAALDRLEGMYSISTIGEPAPFEEIIEPEVEVEEEPIVEEEEEIVEDELELKGFAKFLAMFRKPSDPMSKAAQAIEGAAMTVAIKSDAELKEMRKDAVRKEAEYVELKEGMTKIESMREDINAVTDGMERGMDIIEKALIATSKVNMESLQALQRGIEGAAMTASVKSNAELKELKREAVERDIELTKLSQDMSELKVMRKDIDAMGDDVGQGLDIVVKALAATNKVNIEGLQTLRQNMDLLASKKDVDDLSKSVDLDEFGKKVITEIMGKIPAAPVVVSQEVVERDEGKIARIRRTYSDGGIVEFEIERDADGKIERAVRM